MFDWVLETIYIFIQKPGQACNFIKKETSVQVFFCEFCKISKATFFPEHLWATASVYYNLKNVYQIYKDINRSRIKHINPLSTNPTKW